MAARTTLTEDELADKVTMEEYNLQDHINLLEGKHSEVAGFTL